MIGQSSQPAMFDAYRNVCVTLAFVILAPFITFILLLLKGLPSFAVAHLVDVLIWVYQATWLPALLSGLLVSAIVGSLVIRTPYFHQPYDFGRCFSLGAIVGACAEALTTWIYRGVFHRPFSGFWISGAIIAGCLTGAVVIAAVLYFKKRVPVVRKQL